MNNKPAISASFTYMIYLRRGYIALTHREQARGVPSHKNACGNSTTPLMDAKANILASYMFWP
eukprot:scaffold53541_cov36-Prasinocladus_malaysianus.AAC.2